MAKSAPRNPRGAARHPGDDDPQQGWLHSRKQEMAFQLISPLPRLGK